jgi:hypothetical protein
MVSPESQINKSKRTVVVGKGPVGAVEQEGKNVRHLEVDVGTFGPDRHDAERTRADSGHGNGGIDTPVVSFYRRPFFAHSFGQGTGSEADL